jgi:hypothetical protein
MDNTTLGFLEERTTQAWIVRLESNRSMSFTVARVSFLPDGTFYISRLGFRRKPGEQRCFWKLSVEYAQLKDLLKACV